MRRREKEITDQHEIEDILQKAPILHLGMISQGEPYVIAVNFGYNDRTIYIHAAPEGRKIDTLQENDRVCFQTEIDVKLVHTDSAATCSTNYRSVLGYGRAVIITDDAEKKHGLDILMAKTSILKHKYPQSMVDRMVIIKVEIESITGKRSE